MSKFLKGWEYFSFICQFGFYRPLNFASSVNINNKWKSIRNWLHCTYLLWKNLHCDNDSKSSCEKRMLILFQKRWSGELKCMNGVSIILWWKMREYTQLKHDKVHNIFIKVCRYTDRLIERQAKTWSLCSLHRHIDEYSIVLCLSQNITLHSLPLALSIFLKIANTFGWNKVSDGIIMLTFIVVKWTHHLCGFFPI